METYEMTFLSVCHPSKRLKSGIVDPEEATVFRQRLDKHFPTAKNARATIELLDVVVSMSI
jgi:hypothetical protein